MTVTKKNNAAFYVKMYDLDTTEQTFEELFGSNEEHAEDHNYIKMKDIEQNSTGQLFALPYFNDGLFLLRIFGKQTRSIEEIQE